MIRVQQGRSSAVLTRFFLLLIHTLPKVRSLGGFQRESGCLGLAITFDARESLIDT